MKYFIKTYTNEGDLILDNTMGSGTTNLGSFILNRRSIGIDNDKTSFDKAVKRITDYI
jgi:site-specific DNA-methyltransferase (adenine-specific)